MNKIPCSHVHKICLKAYQLFAIITKHEAETEIHGDCFQKPKSRKKNKIKKVQEIILHANDANPLGFQGFGSPILHFCLLMHHFHLQFGWHLGANQIHGPSWDQQNVSQGPPLCFMAAIGGGGSNPALNRMRWTGSEGCAPTDNQYLQQFFFLKKI